MSKSEKIKKSEKLCYECDPNRKGGYNHVKCTVRLKRKNAKCECWCTKKDSHYNLHMNKTRVKD